MVTLYVEGRPVGTLADAEKLLPEFAAKNLRVEFRDASGNPIGTFTPAPPPPAGEPPVPWDPSITQADIDRVRAEPGLPFEEVKKRLGMA